MIAAGEAEQAALLRAEREEAARLAEVDALLAAQPA